MQRRKRNLALGIVTLIIVFVVYFSIQWYYLTTTLDIPNRNLFDFSSGSCLVYFNIRYKGETYPLIGDNLSTSNSFFKSYFLASTVYPLYMNEIINHDWSIDVDDSLFFEFKHSIVRKDLLLKYSQIDILNDPMIVSNGKIQEHLAGEHQKAIIYTLLRQGVNCCRDDESGNVFVGDD